MKVIHILLLTTVLGTVSVADARAQADLETTVSHLQFRSIGPARMGGRIADLAVVEAKPQVFYVGTASGGVWKTVNHGTSWTPLFDDQPTGSIGDVTVHQANPNLIWVGTGEPQNRQSSPWGDGVYKSTDAGNTWTHMGLDETKHIARILIHPRDPDIVYVAAVGDLWGPNEERGVYRTRDGGQTWENILFIDEHTGAIDMGMDPGDPNTIFAAMYQRRRTGWGFNGGGPGSGLYRSTDAGENWIELTEGLPEGDKGRIGIDVFRQDGNVVYALVEADARRAGGVAEDAAAAAELRAVACSVPLTAVTPGRRCPTRTRGRCTIPKCALIRVTLTASMCSEARSWCQMMPGGHFGATVLHKSMSITTHYGSTLTILIILF